MEFPNTKDESEFPLSSLHLPFSIVPFQWTEEGRFARETMSLKQIVGQSEYGSIDYFTSLLRRVRVYWLDLASRFKGIDLWSFRALQGGNSAIEETREGRKLECPRRWQTSYEDAQYVHFYISLILLKLISFVSLTLSKKSETHLIFSTFFAG